MGPRWMGCWESLLSGLNTGHLGWALEQLQCLEDRHNAVEMTTSSTSLGVSCTLTFGHVLVVFGKKPSGQSDQASLFSVREDLVISLNHCNLATEQKLELPFG